MHASSLENMRRCYRRYLAGAETQPRRRTVVEVGAADVNGSYRDVFPADAFEYVGVDLAPGPGVSMVLSDPYSLPFGDRQIDVVVSGQMLEHSAFFWRAFQEMVRILKDDGLLFLIAPSAGQVHRYPVDCYRFLPDSYQALAEYAGCELVEWWIDERGPWHDLVGVFQHRDGPRRTVMPTGPAARQDFVGQGTADEEKMTGDLSYVDVLRSLHENLQPDRYLEIGVGRGNSLSLARCLAIGVDPSPKVDVDLPEAAVVVPMTSDEYFEDVWRDHWSNASPDLVFIDGMHLAEYALRDFMNVERIASPATLVVVDDVFPNHPRQASRLRQTRAWTGDVWKFIDCLREGRPDLTLFALDAAPAGLMLIAGLDPRNRYLWENYNQLVRGFMEASDVPPPSVLERRHALPGASPVVARVAAELHEARQSPIPPASLSARLQGIKGAVVSNTTDAPAGAVRTFASALPADLLMNLQAGALRTTYRGVPCLKTPFDLALYMQLIGRLRPATVIEIGTKSGGSALWFADVLTAHGIPNPRVVTVDREPLVEYVDPRIDVITGLAADLAAVLSSSDLETLEKPWLIVEDSSHLYDDILAVLGFFHRYMQPGDYFVVEDGIVSQFPDPGYGRFEDGPNRAVRKFLADYGDAYAVDTELCDFYGYNVTWNPNGWLYRRH